ncbi:MAG: helix-turn-helix domain-containing protein [Candidatus Melainabacteria bacterium]|nr:MAG: helix-turn-helix domain-containing protein [Candidatus Melainabacteria bacterium]
MILNELEYARANARIAMLKSRCDLMRRRVADPYKAAAAEIEIDRLEIRIAELTNQVRAYYRVVDRSAVVQNMSASFTQALIDIPTRLIERRIRVGWSQYDLAKACGQTRQVISGYERSRYASVSLKRLIAIDFVLRTEEIRRFGARGKEKLGMDAILGSDGIACPFRAADQDFEGKDER